jgi:hypothetical protein
MIDTTDKRHAGRLAGPAAFAHFGLLAIAIGNALMMAIFRPPVAEMLDDALLSTSLRYRQHSPRRCR